MKPTHSDPKTSAQCYPVDHGSPYRAALAGMREACGAPALVLGASYLGFGSLVRETGLSLGVGLFSTISTWALPGQIALVELYALGASVVAIFIAVALTNARMMPMTITLMPLLRVPGRPHWRNYLAAHLVAVTGWAVAMIRCPDMPPAQRMPFFVGFAGTILGAALAGTVAGFLLSGVVPVAVSLGLVFVNPMYFMLLFLGDLRHRGRVLALVCGAVAGPLFHLVTPTWDLLLTGVIGGVLAFAIDRQLRRRHV
ncbi:MAG TPA: AzlC family ABC transporter permease [Alphaproteobacteria bacterium]